MSLIISMKVPERIVVATDSCMTLTMEADMKRLLMDDDVTKKAGGVPYLLSPREPHDERHLSIRAFTEALKLRADLARRLDEYKDKNGVNKAFVIEKALEEHLDRVAPVGENE